MHLIFLNTASNSNKFLNIIFFKLKIIFKNSFHFSQFYDLKCLNKLLINFYIIFL
jgi:hypothetical protein